MTRYFGKIGFATERETAPGVFREVVVDHEYYGTINRASRTLVQSPLSADFDVQPSNQIDILADAFASTNAFDIRYAEWQGVRWRVTNIEIQRPRLILTLGGVWNGETS